MDLIIKHFALLSDLFLARERVTHTRFSLGDHVLLIVEALTSAILRSSGRLQEDTSTALGVPRDVPHRLASTCRVSADEELGWQVQVINQLVPPVVDVLLSGLLRLKGVPNVLCA